MNDLRLKNKKRNRRYSLIARSAAIAALIAVLILVVLYGRVERVGIPDMPSKAASGNSGTKAIKNEQLSGEQIDALRQKYIGQMQLYETKTVVEIEKLNLQAWSPESAAELQAQEKEVVEAFAKNQFADALTRLDGLLARVTELQAIQNQKFSSALENARQAFASGYVKQAFSAINKALRYQPESRDARLLRDRVNTMEAVAELLKAAEVARTENNLDEEIDLLDKAIKHDPHRSELVERRKLLAERRRQQELDALLRRASQALDDKNIKEAQANTAQIRQIDAQHPSLRWLENKTKQIQAELSYRGLITKAEAAEHNDDWQAAARYYQRARRIFSDDEKVEDRLQRAARIIHYTQMVERALARPQRLADEQISMAMKKISEEGSGQAQYSARLQGLIEQLDDAIAKMSKPVEVVVYSDEKTYVSVLGVGVIGQVSEYRLKEGLKPGSYLFKGERKGYKDKLIEVHIKPAEAAVVRIVCDEAI